MFAGIKRFFLPFQAIAEQLTRIADLYELELREREQPIIRITQDPAKGDTEVFYGADDTRPKSKLRSLFDGSQPEEDEVDPLDDDQIV